LPSPVRPVATMETERESIHFHPKSHRQVGARGRQS
jgi:hypothetical protein